MSDLEVTKAWQTILRTEGAGFSDHQLTSMQETIRKWQGARYAAKHYWLSYHQEWKNRKSWSYLGGATNVATDSHTPIITLTKDFWKELAARHQLAADDFEKYKVSFRLTDINGTQFDENFDISYIPQGGDHINIYLHQPRKSSKRLVGNK